MRETRSVEDRLIIAVRQSKTDVIHFSLNDGTTCRTADFGSSYLRYALEVEDFVLPNNAPELMNIVNLNLYPDRNKYYTCEGNKDYSFWQINTRLVEAAEYFARLVKGELPLKEFKSFYLVGDDLAKTRGIREIFEYEFGMRGLLFKEETAYEQISYGDYDMLYAKVMNGGTLC